MLDWMKKLFKKEESEPEREPSEVPQTDHYSNNMEQTDIELKRSQQYPSGKFRFPLIPDERQQHPMEPPNREVSRVERIEKTEREVPIQAEKKRMVQPKPIVRQEVKPEPVPIRSSRPVSNRRPFRPTETISPVFGYKRPTEDLWKKQRQEDLVLSANEKSVVDAWMEKNGYVLQFSSSVTVVEDKTPEDVHHLGPNIKEEQEVFEHPAIAHQPSKPLQEDIVEQERIDSEWESLEQAIEHPVHAAQEQQIDASEQAEVEEAEEMESFYVSEQSEPEQAEIEEAEEMESFYVSEQSEPEQAEIEEAEEMESFYVSEQSESEQAEVEEAEEMESFCVSEQNEPEQAEVEEAEEMESFYVSEQSEPGQAEIEEVEEMESFYVSEQSEPGQAEIEEVEEMESFYVSEQSEPEQAEIEETEEMESFYISEQSEPEQVKVEEAEEVQNIDMSEQTDNQSFPKEPSFSAHNETREEVAKEKTETREKKRFVPYNVMMLKQDRTKLTKTQPTATSTYSFPPLHLLNIPDLSSTNDEEWLKEQTELLNTAFDNFHVGARVVHVTQGPSVTRFEVQPEPGVKVNKITNLADDIKLNLAAKDIRIEAPIPGKNAVGIEVPNRKSKPVFLREILRSPVFTKSESPLTVALGLDISGTPIVTDIRKMPHGLIAGATGSGKSVCINAILTSILYKAMPHEVKLLLIDPKMVELAPYNEVPHLVAPVITDVKAATAALKWAVDEMERRYESFAHAGARDLTRYNDLVKQKITPGEPMPYIVIVIDELADLMMVSPADVEEAICRIAQKARACGIHLLVATQRPSVDVITGLIKANIPTRIAFTVSSQVDSRTIIDISGAEKLLGRGDMLFLENGTSKPIRAQGVYVSDEEIESTVVHVKKQMKPNYLFQQEDLLTKVDQQEAEDELFYEACQFVLEQGGASTSSLQRRFRIGYNRAARLMEDMEAQGIISEARGTKPRDVLITGDDLAAMQDMNM
ncbi:DNA translocase FtsK [Microbacteriaceae bacterium 4G12]